VDHLYEISKEELISEAPHALDLLREDGNGVIIALTLNGQVAGFIRYKEEEEVTKITFYAIAKEYRGLGLFHALFDALVETLQTSEVIVPFIGDSLKVLQMFEGVTHQVISKSISLPIEEWQEG